MKYKTHIIKYFTASASALLWCGRIMGDMEPGDTENAKPVDGSMKCKKCLQALNADTQRKSKEVPV